jgi:hypothetical protein
VSSAEPTYRFVRGQGWILGPDYHSDVLEILDVRSPGNTEEWCRYEVKNNTPNVTFAKDWTDQYGYRRFDSIEKAIYFAESDIRPHLRTGWVARIVICDKDDGRVWAS